jgi:hypothetical protein
MNAIISFARKAAMIAVSIVLAAGLSGCAPIWGLAAVGAGVSLLAIDSHDGPHTSAAPVRPAERSEALSPRAVDAAFGI